MKRIILIAVKLCVVVVLMRMPAAFAQVVEGLSLDGLIAEAMAENPRIQEAYQGWKAAEYRIKTVKSLDNPMIEYMLPGGEDLQTRVGPQMRRYSVSQKIPFPYKLSLKGKSQAAEAQMLSERHDAVTNEVIKDVKSVYYDLFLIDRSIQINEEEKSLLEKLEKVAQRRYESNRLAQQDVIKVQVELSNIIHKLLLLRQSRESLNVKLNSLLARPPDSPIGSIDAVGTVGHDYTLPELMGMVGKSRQELVMSGLSVKKAEYEMTLAKMEYLPDFTIGGDYIEIGGGTTTNANDGQDAWMGTVAVDVPIWFGKLRAQFKEKEAALQAAKENQSNMENSVGFEVQDMYFQLNAYKDIVLLYETALLPQAQQAFDASQTGFETGAISFLDWLDTERTYLQTRLAYYKAITDYHKSVAQLERIVGDRLKGGENVQ